MRGPHEGGPQHQSNRTCPPNGSPRRTTQTPKQHQEGYTGPQPRWANPDQESRHQRHWQGAVQHCNSGHVGQSCQRQQRRAARNRTSSSQVRRPDKVEATPAIKRPATTEHERKVSKKGPTASYACVHGVCHRINQPNPRRPCSHRQPHWKASTQHRGARVSQQS